MNNTAAVFLPTLDRVLLSWVMVLLKLMYLKSLIQAKKTQMATALLFCLLQLPKTVKSAN